MIKSLKYLSIAVVSAMVVVPSVAQTTSTSLSADTTSITRRINNSGIINVSHPAALEMRLGKSVAESDSVQPAIDEKKTTGRVKKMGGYRVQIYSDNNARTAKNEARAKERAILGVYPDLATYVIYDSPYWRLRVGDCRSRAEAEELANEMKKAFPGYRSEITVVRDRINAVN